MKKKLMKVFAATALFAGLLAGCGAGGSGNGASSSGSGGDTIKIGLNLELSGAVASYGTGIKQGVDLAVEEINAAGGVDGKEIQLIPIDNKSDGQEATNGAIKLTDQDKVVAIIGAATSGNTIAQVEIANNNKTVLITPSGTSLVVTKNEKGELNEYAFRTTFIDPFQGTVAANFALNELGVKTAAVYGDNASDYAKGLGAAFIETFEAGGGTIVAQESYIAKDTDFRSTLTRIKTANPDFVYIPGYYEEVGLIVKQARELGIEVPLMGGDGWDSPTLVELAGAGALNNTFVTAAYAAEDPDPMIQNFVKAFTEKYGEAPDGFSALGYDTVYLLKDAIERAGAVDSVKIKEALEQTKDFPLVTGALTIDENHNPIKAATILEFVDGEMKFNSKVNPE
ncbi:ABC transporter substrate-binding protein [Sporosarcina sp. ACRSL]|uniref:ABC transporter substrate-binding protein n=1 Tax=Sporosarcina sp. ACRSL TaxID=2918215 RepID=UPI001EF4DDB8|nr:ABC transporter substrate-binding protein [Sporosarcina sp. ACRSL]MCG7346522.1 ABC transporter substrate-binding protein [Sporosarcina sp. ACRSL]